VERDDGVNREGLHYRAGWVEALQAFGVQVNIEAARAKSKEMAGLQLASQIAQRMFKAMLDKMKSHKEPESAE
jgi:hypothetical protein